MAAPYASSPQPASPSKQKLPGGMIWVGAILMVLAVLAGIVLVVLGAQKVVKLAEAPIMSVPGKQTYNLDAGDQVVFEYGTFLSASDITVTGPGGNDISVNALGSTSYSTSSGGRTFDGVGRFNAPSSGAYTIEVTERTAAGGQVLVGPDIIGASLLFILGGVFGGGFLFLIGLILLIIGLVRRSGAKKRRDRPQGGGFPGPGYPQPGFQQPGYPQPGYASPAPQPPPSYPPPQGPPAAPAGPGGPPPQ